MTAETMVVRVDRDRNLVGEPGSLADLEDQGWTVTSWDFGSDRDGWRVHLER